MSDTIALAALLANLAAELRTMTGRCHALEDGALAAIGVHSGALPAGTLGRLQQLDFLKQELADLARLAEAAAGAARISDRVQCVQIRASLTMTSLADRLLGEGKAHEQQSDFLL